MSHSLTVLLKKFERTLASHQSPIQTIAHSYNLG